MIHVPIFLDALEGIIRYPKHLANRCVSLDREVLDGLARLETMVMMSGFEMPIKAMRQQVAGTPSDLAALTCETVTAITQPRKSVKVDWRSDL